VSDRQVSASDTFGTLVRQHRLALGLSQEELASRSGLSVRAIADMERGRTARPRRYSVQSLSDALGLPDPLRHQLDRAARVFASGLIQPPATETRPLPIPRQLPASVASFVGRTRELQALTDISEDVTRAGGAVVISSIGGTAGVGKTALAVHWAHQSEDRFPDGQLYVNLQGYDLAGPVTVAQALAGFLAALGAPAADLPAEAEQLASMYRSMLADRRLLVVLDNANHVEQVRPLLPGSPGCMVLVTSRDSLPGLVARDGARRLTVDLLPHAEAVSLLRSLVGRRVDAEPAAAKALAARCSRLPLALRVAAELAAARPATKLADLVNELTGQQQQLDLLNAGDDPRATVRTVFSWSYQYLQPETAGMFRLLGSHPGAEVDCYSAAALAGVSLQAAGGILERLARAHLIEPDGPVRYRMHDLLRAYARELAVTQQSEATHDAVTRLCAYYLYTASTAMDVLIPAERGRRPRVARPATSVPQLGTEQSARAWLDAERANLVAAIAYMASNGGLHQAVELAATLFRYLDLGGHFTQAETVHAAARQAALQLGDHAAEATALVNLGSVSFRRGHHRQAASYFEQALELCSKADTPIGRIRALNNLGLANLELGNHTLASQHFQECLSLSADMGELVSRARALSHLSVVDIKRGNYRQAIGRLEQALAAFREIGDPIDESGVLAKLAMIDLRQQAPAHASVRARQALKLYRQTGDRTGEADALVLVADAELLLGSYKNAMSHIRRSLMMHREIGSKSGEARALNVLGDLLLATGRSTQARRAHISALSISNQTGDREEEARSHSGLAVGYEATGDEVQANTHWQRALSLYTDLHGPVAHQIRTRPHRIPAGRPAPSLQDDPGLSGNQTASATAT
jgi:tetratricopeptide (TPR) repeat protein/transcriptional regulator with XRE-family HTH domain